MALLGWLKNNCNSRCPEIVTFLYLPILYSYWMRQKESPQETKLKMLIQSFPINCTGLVACTQYPTSPTDPPRHIMHSHKYWTHAHVTVSLRGVIKWQTVLAMSTNGHFNALGVKGLVLRGHLIRAGVFNTSPTKRSVSKGGRLWWMLGLPHTCTQGPQYVPSPPISPTTIPKLDPFPPSFLRQPPFPLTHSVASPSGLRIHPLSLGAAQVMQNSREEHAECELIGLVFRIGAGCLRWSHGDFLCLG